jgi:phosphatidylethanolamine/phosphatidyl-N-methylethanolamine N-methyltransferase
MSSAEWINLERSAFIERWYDQQYRENAYGGVAGLMQSYMHRSLERGYDSTTHFQRVLEVGGNTGEHLEFVRHAYETYTLSDLEDRRDEVRIREHGLRNVQFAQANVLRLPWGDASFDRVVNTCVLHHVNDAEAALGEIRRVLRIGGVADVFLTGDPGLAFRLGRYLGPMRTARSAGLTDVKRLMDARDHVNHVGGLLQLISHVFRHDRVARRSYPFNLPGWNASLWHTFRFVKRRP